MPKGMGVLGRHGRKTNYEEVQSFLMNNGFTFFDSYDSVGSLLQRDKNILRKKGYLTHHIEVNDGIDLWIRKE